MSQSLTQSEENILRAFQNQVGRLRQSSIIQQMRLDLSIKTNIDFSTGEVSVEYEGYDKELFQAQMPLLRQFFLQNDALYFNKIHNLICKCCSRQELVDLTAYARRKWKNILDSVTKELHPLFHLHSITVDDAIDKIFYGYAGLFHANTEAPEEDETNRAILESTFQYVFPNLFRCLNILDSVINWWLDATDEDVPPVPTE